MTNVGAQALDVAGSTIAGPDAGDFSVGTSTCLGTPIGFQHTCTVKVGFTPSASGPRTVTLTLSDNEPTPLSFTISGTGVSTGKAGGSPPPGGTGSSKPGAAAPTLSGLSIRPRRTGAGRSETTVRWNDTVTATTTVRILRITTGRRAGHRCVALTTANQGQRRCPRSVARGSLIHHDRAGANVLRFTERFGGHRLARGRYRLMLRAVSGSRRSRTVALTFRIAR